MRLIPSNNGYLAVQGFTGARGRVQVGGWGTSHLEAMAACGDLVAVLDAEAVPQKRSAFSEAWGRVFGPLGAYPHEDIDTCVRRVGVHGVQRMYPGLVAVLDAESQR